MNRKLASWIDAFLQFTERTPSPELFRKWGAISAVAGALERRVWLEVRGWNLIAYPNLYVILVGPPGVGKTVITSQVEQLWHSLEGFHVASADVTSAALIDELASAQRRLIRPGLELISYNSLLIASNELGVLLPAYENTMMNALTSIWDGHPYAQKRRTKDIDIKMERPVLNMLAGTTPSYLNDVMPEGAWDQGFISRCLVIYNGEVIKREPFADDESRSNEALKHDLSAISNLYGKMTFEPDAAMALSTWHMQGGPPAPDHPKLSHYSIRRTAQLLKLCMVASASESDSLLITLDHYQTALGWLLEAEVFMPDLFKAFRKGGDKTVMEEIYHFVYEVWIREKKPVVATRLYAFAAERTPAHNVGRIIQVMESAGLLIRELDKIGTVYRPKPRAPGQ